ncbi:MAG: MgtC/SapB family protein [Bacillota bacterium]
MNKRIRLFLLTIFVLIIFAYFVTQSSYINDALIEQTTINYVELIFKIFLTLFIAAAIGYERESRGRAAGLRTHILVSLGSCLIMIVSIWIGNTGPDHDPARLAAQVVSGIGFLGAGTILKEGSYIRGLTTAASLWVVAAIGLAVGSGHYIAAILITTFVSFTLIIISIAENYFVGNKNTVHFELETNNKPETLKNICYLLENENIEIEKMEYEEKESEKIILDLLLKIPSQYTKNRLIQLFNEENYIKKIQL